MKREPGILLYGVRVGVMVAGLILSQTKRRDQLPELQRLARLSVQRENSKAPDNLLARAQSALSETLPTKTSAAGGRSSGSGYLSSDEIDNVLGRETLELERLKRRSAHGSNRKPSKISLLGPSWIMVTGAYPPTEIPSPRRAAKEVYARPTDSSHET